VDPQKRKAEPTVHKDERELLARVSNGDPAALEILYDRYSATVCAVSMRIAANRDEAEEITLKTFSQLWKETARFDPACGSLPSWLFMMARNRALDEVRSRGSNGDTIACAARMVGDDHFLPDSSEWDTGDAERRPAVRRALAELPASYREALELAYYGGLSYSEIAARTGEPLGTIKSRIAHGVMKLRVLSATLEG
jgi:RNA polymerase sigma-70 factor (ECF subfamily)